VSSPEAVIASLLGNAVAAGTPLLFGTLGEIYAERSGVLNLGIEGMMAVGAVTAFGVTLTTQNVWLGVTAAAAIGGLLALVHAFLSVTLRANQVVSGLALTMFGLGLSGLLGKPYIGRPLPSSLIIRSTYVPILRDIPILGRVLFQQDLLVYLSMALAVLLWFILFKTRLGISVRSVGEDPATSDALGVNVYRTRYLCVLLGGALAGLAGAHLSVAYAPAWTEGMTAGRGWVVVGLTIFSMWLPHRALLGAYLFGGVEALQYALQPLGFSPQILGMLPYIFAIVVLLIGTRETIRKRLGAPAALGLPYSRGEK